jgi:hypothetical protein
MDLPLKEYCIKSSFNSSYDGNDGNVVSNETLLQRINEGYRFIDLNVFSASGDVYVGYSPDNKPTLISGNLTLQDALGTISDTAFSKNQTDFQGSNLSDIGSYPIFVHIRVYRPPNSQTDIISNVADVVNGTPDKKPFYTKNYLKNPEGSPKHIDGCTKLSEIMGKIIFSMDILNILEIYAPPNNQTVAALLPVPKMQETIAKMQSFVNIVTGGNTVPAFYRYTDESIVNRTNKLAYNSDSAITGKNLKTNVKHMVRVTS